MSSTEEGSQRLLSQADIQALAEALAPILVPLLVQQLRGADPPRPVQPGSFAARRQEALQIAAQKGVLPPGRKR